MEKVLRCRDIGVDCDFEAKGKTEDEVLKKAKEHAKSGHGIKRVTEDYLKSWRKHIHNAS
ncbi:MAG: DUF1059 domain-containing protein [Nitrospirae bacterium]|nr:DUF1059 domain-containing protein [Nitrospirota bacterium]